MILSREDRHKKALLEVTFEYIQEAADPEYWKPNREREYGQLLGILGLLSSIIKGFNKDEVGVKR